MMLSVKQGGIKYHFLSLWYDLTWDWNLVSSAIGEHYISNEIGRSKVSVLSNQSCVCVCVCVYLCVGAFEHDRYEKTDVDSETLSMCVCVCVCVCACEQDRDEKTDIDKETIYIYIYIYFKKKKRNRSQRIINLFPSCYAFLKFPKTRKKINRTSSDLLIYIYREIFLIYIYIYRERERERGREIIYMYEQTEIYRLIGRNWDR